MKAVICTKYGASEVLRVKEIEKPVPKVNEVLVKVYSSTVSAGVLWVRSGKHPDLRFFTWMIRLMFGFNKSRNPVLGYEFSGEVEAAGNHVTLFKTGDKVFGITTGLKQGAYTEYACVPERWSRGVIAVMPGNLSFDEAAAIPVGAMTALQLLRKANIREGQRALVHGASGSVGTYAVQLAKYFGATVTGVCSGVNRDLIKSIGADSVIDYTTENFLAKEREYDVVFDAAGKISSSTCRKILKKNGSFVSVKSVTNEKREYLTFLGELIEAGKLRPVIEKCYPLEQIVEAHGHAGTGHKKGNVVIRMRAYE
jgi:NADPH:quinone reductase-like Zn-dependent oxidoreductase